MLSQQGTSLDLMKRSVYHQKVQDLGHKITGTTGGELVLSLSGQKVDVCGEECRLLLIIARQTDRLRQTAGSCCRRRAPRWRAAVLAEGTEVRLTQYVHDLHPGHWGESAKMIICFIIEFTNTCALICTEAWILFFLILY